MKNRKLFHFMILLMLTLSLASPSYAAKILTGTLTTTAGVQKSVEGSWKKSSGKWYFRSSDGETKRGWLKLPAGTYYLQAKGKRATGVVRIKGSYYCFDSQGRQQTGLIEINSQTYYFDPANGGARVGAGKRTIDGVTYTFNSEGQTLRSAFDDEGNFYDSKGYVIRKSTLKHLLQTAMLPVGQTMYVWGGGWSWDVNSTRPEAVTIGVSPQWKAFFKKQSSSYDYRTTRFQTHDGLDCSGYVGWVLYNTFNTVNNHGPYVMLAQQMAKTFASWGWGKYAAPKKFKDWRAGDIMSLPSGHVYIVIGKCSDGSVVLVHSSPKGVMINGTPSSSGKSNSKARKLAKKYMSTYFPEWYAKYPDVSRPSSYLNSYARMRWYLDTKNSVMSDPDGLRNMNAEQVLKVIFGA